jgi:glycogen debranching enzyme
MKKHDYNHIDMYDDYPFKIKSSTSTSLLYASNNFMLKIADIIDEDKTRILDWQSRIKKNFEKTFCPNLSKDPLYYDYDLIAEEHILKQTVGSIIPIYSGIPSKEHADRIVNMLGDSRFCGTSCHVQMVPSTGLHEKEYTPQLYWRGPVWINVNWLIWRGLQNYGYKEKAEQIREGVIELVKEHGFYEYYDATTGEGYGAQNFSWTAALLIDMIKDLGVGTSS